jgi:hypothetical protein
MAGPATALPVTLIVDGNAATARRALVQGEDVWLPVDDLVSATAWELKPEGVCRGETCVPLSSSQRAAMLRDEQASTWFNFSEFARLIEEPVAIDREARTWYFGPPGWEWRSRSEGNAALDFTAQDLAGQLHSLHDLRGKKVFLLFWASW